MASRYPDSHTEGIPNERYGPLQTQQAVSYPRNILEFVCDEVARPRKIL